MKEQEIRDKERIQLLEHIEKMKKEEEIQQEEKRRQINLLIQQAAEANQQALI